MPRLHNADFRNFYVGPIRFANRRTGAILGNRASGGRVLRAELHGYGIECYLRVVSGYELEGGDPHDVDRDEGILRVPEHFVPCVESGDVVKTPWLRDQLEGNRQSVA